MKVRAYRNLNKNMMSIRSDEGITKGLVIAHAHNVSMVDVTFKVNEKTRQKVCEQRQKQVHAFVCGTLVAMEGDMTKNHPHWPESVHSFDYSLSKKDMVKYHEYKFFNYSPYHDIAAFHYIIGGIAYPLHQAESVIMSPTQHIFR